MHRRGFLKGLGSIIAAPAIVPAGSLMAVRGIIMPKDAAISIFSGYEAQHDYSWARAEIVPFWGGEEIHHVARLTVTSGNPDHNGDRARSMLKSVIRRHHPMVAWLIPA